MTKSNFTSCNADKSSAICEVSAHSTLLSFSVTKIVLLKPQRYPTAPKYQVQWDFMIRIPVNNFEIFSTEYAKKLTFMLKAIT